MMKGGNTTGSLTSTGKKRRKRSSLQLKPEINRLENFVNEKISLLAKFYPIYLVATDEDDGGPVVIYVIRI